MDDSEFFRDENASEQDEEDPFEDDYYAFFNLQKEVSKTWRSDDWIYLKYYF